MGIIRILINLHTLSNKFYNLTIIYGPPKIRFLTIVLLDIKKRIGLCPTLKIFVSMCTHVYMWFKSEKCYFCNKLFLFKLFSNK